jgi:hypothetical protein
MLFDLVFTHDLYAFFITVLYENKSLSLVSGLKYLRSYS